MGMTLNDFMEKNGVTCASLADQLGVTRQAVYFWLTFQRTPSARYMAQIARITDGAVMPNDLIFPSGGGKNAGD
jgi:hypothetical protein